MNNCTSNSRNRDCVPDLNQEKIFLIDALHILKSAWKTIVIAGLLGTFLSFVYLLSAPKKYEATAQIAMAQIVVDSGSINPLGTNIEEPSLLIERMSSPTSLTPQVIAACGLQDEANAALVLSKLMKLMISKNSANIVVLNTFGPSPRVAEQCGLAVFELIKTTQSLIMAPYVAEATAMLGDNVARLNEARDLVARGDKSGSAYLATRDEIRYLLDDIASLKNIIASSVNRATHLVSPIYVSDMPVTPKKRNVLAIGLFFGIFMGILIALCKKRPLIKND